MRSVIAKDSDMPAVPSQSTSSSGEAVANATGNRQEMTSPQRSPPTPSAASFWSPGNPPQTHQEDVPARENAFPNAHPRAVEEGKGARYNRKKKGEHGEPSRSHHRSSRARPTIPAPPRRHFFLVDCDDDWMGYGNMQDSGRPANRLHPHKRELPEAAKPPLSNCVARTATPAANGEVSGTSFRGPISRTSPATPSRFDARYRGDSGVYASEVGAPALSFPASVGLNGVPASSLSKRQLKRRLKKLGVERSIYDPVELQIESISALALRITLALWYSCLIFALTVDVVPGFQWSMVNMCGNGFRAELRYVNKWSSPCAVATPDTGAGSTVTLRWNNTGAAHLQNKLVRYRRFVLSLSSPAEQVADIQYYPVVAETRVAGESSELIAQYPLTLSCVKGAARCVTERVPDEVLGDSPPLPNQLSFALLSLPTSFVARANESAVGIAYQRSAYTIATITWRYVLMVLSLLHTLRFLVHRRYTSTLYEQDWTLVLQMALLWYLDPLFGLNITTWPMPAVLAFLEYRLPTYFMAVFIAYMLSVMTASMKWARPAEMKLGSGIWARVQRFLRRSQNVYDPPMWTKILICCYTLSIFILDLVDASLDGNNWYLAANSETRFKRIFWAVISLHLAGGVVSLALMIYLRNYLGQKPYLESRPQQLACRLFLMVFLSAIVYYIIHCFVFFLLYNREYAALGSQQPFLQLSPLMVASFFTNIMTLVYTTQNRDENVPIHPRDPRWKHMVWPDTWYSWLARHGGSQYIFATELEETRFYRLQLNFRWRQFMARQKRRMIRGKSKAPNLMGFTDVQLPGYLSESTVSTRWRSDVRESPLPSRQISDFEGESGDEDGKSQAFGKHVHGKARRAATGEDSTDQPLDWECAAEPPRAIRSNLPTGSSRRLDRVESFGNTRPHGQSFGNPHADTEMRETMPVDLLARHVINMDRFSSFFLPVSGSVKTGNGQREVPPVDAPLGDSTGKGGGSRMASGSNPGAARHASSAGGDFCRVEGSARQRFRQVQRAATTVGDDFRCVGNDRLSQSYGPSRVPDGVAPVRGTSIPRAARNTAESLEHHNSGRNTQNRSSLASDETALPGGPNVECGTDTARRTRASLHRTRASPHSSTVPRYLDPTASVFDTAANTREDIRAEKPPTFELVPERAISEHINDDGPADEVDGTPNRERFVEEEINLHDNLTDQQGGLHRMASQSEQRRGSDSNSDEKRGGTSRGGPRGLLRTFSMARERLGALMGAVEMNLVERPVRGLDRLEAHIFNAAYRPFQSINYLPFFNLETAIDCFNISWEAYGVEENIGDLPIETGIPLRPRNVPRTLAHGVKKVLCGCCPAEEVVSDDDDDGSECDEETQREDGVRHRRNSEIRTAKEEASVREGASAAVPPSLHESSIKQQQQQQVTNAPHVEHTDDPNTVFLRMDDEREGVFAEAVESNTHSLHPSASQARLSHFAAEAEDTRRESVAVPNAADSASLPINVSQYGFERLLVAEAREVQVIMVKMDINAPEHHGKAPRVIIGFRGTVNLSNAKYDMNLHRVVWREMERESAQHGENDSTANRSSTHVTDSTAMAKYLGLRSCLRSCAHRSSWQPTCHAGFLAIWRSLKSRVLCRLRDLLQEDRDTVYRIFTTGHSLGGALASLCAYSITGMLKRMEYSIPDVTVYTFGQPRLGNRTFQAIFNKAVPRTFRVVNESDAFATIALFGGYHVGIEVDIDRNGNFIVKPTTIEKMFPPTTGRGLAVVNHLMTNYAVSLNTIASRTACLARAGAVYLTADPERVAQGAKSREGRTATVR